MFKKTPFLQDNEEDPVAEETTQKQLISDKETTLPNATTEPEAVQEAVQEMSMEIHDHIPENSSVEQTKQTEKSMSNNRSQDREESKGNQCI